MRATLAATLALSGVALAQAQDFRPDSDAWNGLRDLLGVAVDAGLRIDTPAEVDLAALTRADSLLLLHPTEPVPKGSLVDFLRAGGRVAVADDFGRADELLRSYGIRRLPPTLDENVPRLRGNPALPIASPRLRHPLMEGVQGLVTNHPAVLLHPHLEPIAAFGQSREALVLAGAVEEGRLVAIGDPSVFINNMMRFRSNRRFAENLLRYLDAGRGGRVVLATPDALLHGRFGDAAGDPIERLNGRLRDLAEVELPPLALNLTSLVLAAILLLFAGSALPLRSPYSRDVVDMGGDRAGGYLGRIRFFGGRRDLVHALMVYKFEFEAELLRRLRLDAPPLLRELVVDLRRAGLSPGDAAALEELLTDLDDLHRRLDRPPGAPKITPRRLRRMVDTGERILARVAELEPSWARVREGRERPR